MTRSYPKLDREPLDHERHQVISLYGRQSTARLAEMQVFCDAYGVALPENEVDPATIPGDGNHWLRTTAYRE